MPSRVPTRPDAGRELQHGVRAELDRRRGCRLGHASVCRRAVASRGAVMRNFAMPFRRGTADPNDHHHADDRQRQDQHAPLPRWTGGRPQRSLNDPVHRSLLGRLPSLFSRSECRESSPQPDEGDRVLLPRRRANTAPCRVAREADETCELCRRGRRSLETDHGSFGEEYIDEVLLAGPMLQRCVDRSLVRRKTGLDGDDRCHTGECLRLRIQSVEP